MHSPNNNKRTTPKLHRKNSAGSRSGRKQRSEDKVSLMESAMDDEDEGAEISRLTPSSADSRSRNSSIRHFDLLQVPGNCGLNKNTSTSDAALSIVSFDMDHLSTADRSESTAISVGDPLSPLSLQIPDQHITPLDCNKNCNGNIAYTPRVVMNGSPGCHGEHTPLLTSPRESINGGSHLLAYKDHNKQTAFKNAFSGSSINIVDGEIRKHRHRRSISHASLYSKSDGKYIVDVSVVSSQLYFCSNCIFVIGCSIAV